MNRDHIHVIFLHPPIPMRAFDWCAYFDGGEETLAGHGSTPEAAVKELLEEADERQT